EAGKQLAHGTRIEQRAGEAVLPDFSGFLQHINVFFAERPIGILSVVFVNKLREPQGSSHTGRTTADNDNVGFHLGTIDGGERSAKDHGSENRFKRIVSCKSFQERRFNSKSKIVLRKLISDGSVFENAF